MSVIKFSFASRAQLIQLQLSTIQRELATDCKYWSAENRIHQSQLSVLLSHCRDIVSDHYDHETQYVIRLKENMVTQAELAGLKLQEEDLEKLVTRSVSPQIVGHDLDALKAK